MNKVATSPPRWGGLRDQSRSLPRLYLFILCFALSSGPFIQSARLIIVLFLGTRAIILRWYPFNLRFALSSRVHLFNRRGWSSCSHWELALLFWDDSRPVYALHSYPGFAHSICGINHHALFGSSRYYPETILVQSVLCALIWDPLVQSTQLIVMLSSELLRQIFHFSCKNIIMIMSYVPCPPKFYGDIRAFEIS